MDIVVSQAIVKKGDLWFTIKVDGTKDRTEKENVSIVIHYVKKEKLERRELLVIANAESCEQDITNIIMFDLDKEGLSPNKILNQVYDGASVMS